MESAFHFQISLLALVLNSNDMIFCFLLKWKTRSYSSWFFLFSVHWTFLNPRLSCQATDSSDLSQISQSLEASS